MTSPEQLRINVITGHRKRKGLCLKCGLNSHTDECIENYDKVDNTNINKKPIETNFEKRKQVILHFRRKKNLCLKCGLEPHNGNCIESYIKSDNRDLTDKQFRPAIIETPKFKPTTIIEKLQEKDILPKIELHANKKIKLQRDFVILDIRKNKNGHTVDFTCLNILSRKLNNFIICILGEPEKEFPFSDCLKIKKLVNIHKIPTNQQIIVDFLSSCRKYYSFENEYTYFCKLNSIPTYIFDDSKNVTNFLKDSAFII